MTTNNWFLTEQGRYEINDNICVDLYTNDIGVVIETIIPYKEKKIFISSKIISVYRCKISDWDINKYHIGDIVKDHYGCTWEVVNVNKVLKCYNLKDRKNITHSVSLGEPFSFAHSNYSLIE